MDELTKPLLWHRLRRDQIRRLATADAPVTVVPVGSIEQHGDHLPLDTDCYTAEAIAREASARAQFPVLVAPTVSWGVSGYWMDYPGTIALDSTTLERLLTDVCRSIAHHGFRHIVLVNGHSGNIGALHSVVLRMAAARVRICALHYWSLSQPTISHLSTADHGSIGHSGEVETSLQLHLRPELVGSLERDWSTSTLPRSVLPETYAGAVIVSPDPLAESPSGVYGNGGAASAELGREVLEASVVGLVNFLQTFRLLDLPSAPPLDS